MFANAALLSGVGMLNAHIILLTTDNRRLLLTDGPSTWGGAVSDKELNRVLINGV